MLRRIITIIILMGMQTAAFSQLLPVLDQYWLNGLAINPAYAGSQEALSIGLDARTQWVGFEGAPKTFTFSLHSPLRNKRIALGILVMNDRIGSRNETGFMFNYAYRIGIGAGKLSFGLAAGLSHLSTNMDMVRYTDPGDGVILNSQDKALLPEFSFGVYYYSEKYYVGFSMPTFLKHPLNEANGKYKISFDPLATNYLLTAGYLFKLSDNFKLLPSMLFQTNPANQTQLDLNCSVIFQEKVWLGTSFRTNSSMSVLFQFQASKQFRIAYSYGFEFSELSNYQKGSHEVMLIYNFKYKLDVFSPRFF